MILKNCNIFQFLFTGLIFLIASFQAFSQVHFPGSDTGQVHFSVQKLCDTLEFCSPAEIISHYESWRFNLDSARKHKKIPRIYVHSFPKELKKAPYSQKKKIFIGTTLAAVLKANEEIAFERNEIECLSKKDTLSHLDSVFLADIKRRYYASTFEEMLEKVDCLPPSLVIAQGINESGWGTSFFALHANSVFGMKAPANSSVPTIKHPVHSFVSYKFNSLDEGIKEYMLNINRHRLYKPLREIRADRRIKNLPLTGKPLLKGMKRYSSRGQAYLNTIRKAIDIYNLEEFDCCNLHRGRSIYLTAGR